MATVLISCNSTVPGADHPGTPALVHLDNGDWEIAYNGDVSYISESNAFVGSELVSEILSELSQMYDGEEMDIADGDIILFVEITIETGVSEEPVIGLWEDGMTEIMDRLSAEKLIEIGGKDSLYNFITLPDFMDDLRKFLSKNRNAMFGKEDDERPPLNFGEED